jgi:hypothetical protein
MTSHTVVAPCPPRIHGETGVVEVYVFTNPIDPRIWDTRLDQTSAGLALVSPSPEPHSPFGTPCRDVQLCGDRVNVSGPYYARTATDCDSGLSFAFGPGML